MSFPLRLRLLHTIAYWIQLGKHPASATYDLHCRLNMWRPFDLRYVTDCFFHLQGTLSVESCQSASGSVPLPIHVSFETL